MAPEVRVDNPGGRWLEEKRAGVEAAARALPQGLTGRRLGGAVTAQVRAVLRTAELARLEGALGEVREPGEAKYDRLARRVKRDGWDPGQDGNALAVGVNHLGQAFLIEGNTRAALAAALGIGGLKTDVFWFNGAEDVPGPFRLGADFSARLAPSEPGDDFAPEDPCP